MAKQRHLNDDDIRVVLNSESDSDITDSDIDYNSENNETSDFEAESEPDVAATSCDPLFIAKNKMVWSDTPLPQPIKTAAENIISAQPGPTRFAVSICSDTMSVHLDVDVFLSTSNRKNYHRKY